MANVKISELTGAGTLTGAELVEVVQSGTNKKATTQDIADLAGGGGGGGATIYSSDGTVADVERNITLQSNGVLNIKTDGGTTIASFGEDGDIFASMPATNFIGVINCPQIISSGNVHAQNYLFGRKQVIAKTADFTANDDSGTVYTNEGATSGVVATMTGQATGYEITFLGVESGQSMFFLPPSGTSMKWWDPVSGTVLTATNTQAGALSEGMSITFVLVSEFLWVATAVNGAFLG